MKELMMRRVILLTVFIFRCSQWVSASFCGFRLWRRCNANKYWTCVTDHGIISKDQLKMSTFSRHYYKNYRRVESGNQLDDRD